MITEQDVQRYLSDGFLVVPDVLSADELATLHDEVRKLCRGAYPSKVLPPVGPEVTDDEAMADIYCIFDAHRISPVIAAYLQHERVAAVLSRLVGAHLPHWDGAVKAMQSQVFVKPPGFQGMAWHQDEAYIPTRDRSLCAVWIALDDATEDNGTMRVIPGSHRMGYLWPQRDHGRLDEFDYAPEAYGFDEGAEQRVDVPAGAALFIHGYLLHRSTRNRSARTRRVLSFHTMNAWSVLPWLHPAGMDPVSKADVRRITMIHGRDPYAWKGVEDPGDVALRTCSVNEARLTDRWQRAFGDDLE